jgi:fucose permease
MLSLRNRDALVVGLAYFSFIVLGMPGAMLGVAWSPHIRNTFDLPLDAVGALLVASTIGYFIASFISGRLLAYLPTGLLMALGCGLGTLGLLGYALAPVWALLVVLALLVGAGAGILDGGMNIYFAAHYGPRLMNWLHACFGLGATLSPLMLNTILEVGGSWRLGYAILGALYGLLVAVFFRTRQQWASLQPAHSAAPPAVQASAAATLRLPVVWFGIILFMAYAGAEAGAGQWAFSLFHEERGVGETLARAWVSVYWGSFTIGRVFFGAIVNRVGAATLVRGCLVGLSAGLVLLWWNPTNEAGFMGLALFGFMLAPIFALMVTNTQERLGPSHAPNAIGFQVAAASIGAGGLPGLAGLLADNFGLEVVPPFLLGLAGLLALTYFAINPPALAKARRAQGPAPEQVS